MSTKKEIWPQLHGGLTLLLATAVIGLIVKLGDQPSAEDVAEVIVKDHKDVVVGVAGPPGPGVEPGTVVPFAGPTVPDGWLLCDGTSYTREQHPSLFDAIGTTWGGNGTTFNVPSLGGRYLRGAGGDNAGLNPGPWFSDSAHRAGADGPTVGTYQPFATGPSEDMVTWAPEDGWKKHLFAAKSLSEAETNRVKREDERWTLSMFPWNGETTSHSIAEQRFDAETRPVSATVLYIIKT